MLTTLKEKFFYSCADRINTVTATLWAPRERSPECVIQIISGSYERLDRYDEFARYAVSHGFAVCGSDLPGCGSPQGSRYHPVGKKGRNHLLADIKTLTDAVKTRYPGANLFLLGHSTGALMARLFAARYPGAASGLLLSGTPTKKPVSVAGMLLNLLCLKFCKNKETRTFPWNITLMKFRRKIKNPHTDFDWLTRDDDEVQLIINDPHCSCLNSIGEIWRLNTCLLLANRISSVMKIPSKLPIFLISGTMDLLGWYGRGVQLFYNVLLCAGKKNVTLKLYRDARHELLHETNREAVSADILQWIRTNL